MAASSVAAAGAAVAVYFYNRRSPLFTCGTAPSVDDDGSEQQPSEERAFLRHTGPDNWLEALYFFAEALRCRLCSDAPGTRSWRARMRFLGAFHVIVSSCCTAAMITSMDMHGRY